MLYVFCCFFFFFFFFCCFFFFFFFFFCLFFFLLLFLFFFFFFFFFFQKMALRFHAAISRKYDSLFSGKSIYIKKNKYISESGNGKNDT